MVYFLFVGLVGLWFFLGFGQKWGRGIGHPCKVWGPVKWQEWHLADLAGPDSCFLLNVRLLEEDDASREILGGMLVI